MRIAPLFASLALTWALSGCAFVMRTAADASFPIAQGQARSMFSQTDLAKAKAASSQIHLLESLADDDPDNDAYSVLAARLIGGYCFAFVDPLVGPYDTPDPAKVAKAKALYTKGMNYGMRALLRDKAFAAAKDAAIGTFRKSLQTFGLSDVPALFWTAYNWGQLINLSKDDPFMIAQLPRVSAIMHRVEALDPTYYHGGAYVFDMVDDAARPPMLGGDPQAAKAAYETASAVDDGKFLTTDVLFAQYYCVQIQDAKLFERTLDHVLAAPADILPSESLANAVAKERASFLLSKLDDFFPDLDDASTQPATGSPMPDAQPDAQP